MKESREIYLKRYPVGLPVADDFEMKAVALREIDEGEVLVRNLWMSVDPYMRGRMRNVRSYSPPFALDECMTGGAIGQISESRYAQFPSGSLVRHNSGWRDHLISDGADLEILESDDVPLQTYLGILGMPGMTAYVGLFRIGEIKEGETVFVSAAGGVVGSVACQIAKLQGCRVVGSTGKDSKVEWLKANTQIDTVLNYNQVEDLQEALGEACPDGLDLYFDCVGGSHLEAAIGAMSDFGRVIACGMISTYNDVEPSTAPSNLMLIVRKQIRMQGFIVSDHKEIEAEFKRQMSQWIKDGQIHWEETVVEGLENAPKAFLGLFSGENTGKMLVKLGDAE